MSITVSFFKSDVTKTVSASAIRQQGYYFSDIVHSRKFSKSDVSKQGCLSSGWVNIIFRTLSFIVFKSDVSKMGSLSVIR